MRDASGEAASGSDVKGQLAPVTRLFQYADATDKLLMVVGTLAAIASGTSQPLQIVIFGNILNSFNQVLSAADGAGAAAPDPDAMLTGITKVAIRLV